MRTPRKRITLKTPNKKQTPLRRTTLKASVPTPIAEPLATENNILENYRLENLHLLRLKSDALLFKKFIGLEICERGGKYCVECKIGSRAINFSLEDRQTVYHYKLVNTNISNLPVFLTEEISFEANDIHKFFFKVLEAVISKTS